MAEDFGKQFAAMLIALNLATPQYLIGCSEEEIEKLRLDQRVDFLPEIYRQFLLEMGRECGDLYQGTHLTYPAIFHLKDVLNNQLKDYDRSLQIPDDAFLFMCHQGYVYYYFHTKEKEDDPPVYMITETTDEPVKINEHLSEFFEESVREMRLIGYQEYKKTLSANK